MFWSLPEALTGFRSCLGDILPFFTGFFCYKRNNHYNIPGCLQSGCSLMRWCGVSSCWDRVSWRYSISNVSMLQGKHQSDAECTHGCFFLHLFFPLQSCLVFLLCTLFFQFSYHAHSLPTNLCIREGWSETHLHPDSLQPKLGIKLIDSPGYSCFEKLEIYTMLQKMHHLSRLHGANWGWYVDWGAIWDCKLKRRGTNWCYATCKTPRLHSHNFQQKSIFQPIRKYLNPQDLTCTYQAPTFANPGYRVSELIGTGVWVDHVYRGHGDVIESCRWEVNDLAGQLQGW